MSPLTYTTLVCPECGTQKLGEVRLYEEVHGLDDQKTHSRTRIGFGSPRYVCANFHEFSEPDVRTEPT